MDVQIGVNERGLPRMSVDQPEDGDSIEAPSKEMGRKFKINTLNVALDGIGLTHLRLKK